MSIGAKAVRRHHDRQHLCDADRSEAGGRLEDARNSMPVRFLEHRGFHLGLERLELCELAPEQIYDLARRRAEVRMLAPRASQP